MTSLYIDLEINELQMTIMRIIAKWSREERSPISKQLLIRLMSELAVKESAVENALNGLLKKGYIRHAVSISHQRAYVQLRTVI